MPGIVGLGASTPFGINPGVGFSAFPFYGIQRLNLQPIPPCAAGFEALIRLRLVRDNRLETWTIFSRRKPAAKAGSLRNYFLKLIQSFESGCVLFGNFGHPNEMR